MTPDPINASGSLPLQTSGQAEPESLNRLTRHGLTIRRKKLKDGRWGKWTVRIRFRNKIHPITLCETAKDSFDKAVRARREIHDGRWEQLKETSTLRQLSNTTLADVFTAYRAFKGPDRPSEDTRELNINALTAIIRESGAIDPAAKVENLSLLRLTADLVWKWKETKRKLADDAQDDERALQLLRSANSRLRQARS